MVTPKMLAISLLTVIAWGALVSSSLLASPSGPPSCKVWSAGTAKGADRRPEAEWRDWTIVALADSCEAIPVELRKAAALVRTVKDRKQRAEIMSEAATAVLGPGCRVADPLADARKLAETCPLPPNLRFRLDEPTLAAIRAGDYALLNAMLRALINANEFDEEAERVMLNFALSAEILGDDDRTRKIGRTRPVARPVRRQND